MNNNNQKEKLPDFKELNDRLIADPSPSPGLVIKTNLDKDDVTEDNPYINNSEASNDLKNYFKE